MKILYLGSDVYIDTFKYLVKTQEVLALYTYHNNEDYFNEYQIIEEAHKHHIPVHYENLEENVIIDFFQNKGVELIFCAEYNRIIPTPNIKEFRAVNVHSSLLPVGRGYYPIESAFDKGEKACGVTIHELIKKVDSGKILFQYKYDINENLSSIDCYIKNAIAVKKMTIELMKDIEGCFKRATIQSESFPCWKRPQEDHLIISHTLSVKECLNIYRKYNKLSTICINNKKYYISSIIGYEKNLNVDYKKINENNYLYKVKNGFIQVELVEIKKIT